jgi:monoamine oxidase
VNQLKKYYGKKVDEFIDYKELVWAKEKYTFAPYKEHVLPHQHNGHPLFQNSYLKGRLYVGGSETASQFPGYMEGAVQSANFMYQRLKDDWI